MNRLTFITTNFSRLLKLSVIMLCADIGDDFGDSQPLDEARMLRLTVNGVHLLDSIEMDPDRAFVTELANVGCITWPQRQYIVDLVSSRDKNEKLLDFLTRRSVGDFEKFLKVLSKYQAHVVPLLTTDPGDVHVVNLGYYGYFICRKVLR